MENQNRISLTFSIMPIFQK